MRDTGEGIQLNFWPDIFEPFRQADGSSTRRHDGLGLGLGLVRQIVQAHGGTVQAHSAESETGIAAAQVNLTSLRVLVLDDEEDARALLEDAFTTRGARVKLACSVDQALVVMEEFRPDVVVSHISMPERDGYVFIRAVRALSPERGGRTPAIALTARARLEDSRRVSPPAFSDTSPSRSMSTTS